ncbi:MAG: 3-phosphoshikimate 1-carboxyvinyltransferase [Enterobacterales bacterium]
MQETLTIDPVPYINGIINLPGSKSISNRVLLLAAQAHGITYLTNLLNSDDVRYMLLALKQLGIKYTLSDNNTKCKIIGIGGPLKTKRNLKLFLGNSGIAIRSLTAALCLYSKNVILLGNDRMNHRPIGHLINALRQGKANIKYIKKDNFTPLQLKGGFIGGHITIYGNISSQFLTSLLMMIVPNNTTIYVKGKLVSKPYIKITLKLMKIFGVKIKHENYKIFYIQANSKFISPGKYLIEGDASSASYFLGAAAIRGGTVRVTGVGYNSIQGDIDFANVLKKMGAKIKLGLNYIECTKNYLNAINMDMNHIPDVAMTVAIVALFVSNNNVSVLKNIYNWRVKETDRLTAMATELRKIGAYIIVGNDYLQIKPPLKFIPSIIDTYDDHRMAMCFSLLSLSNVPVTILNPTCVNKTCPDFFNLLKTISVAKNINM